MAGFDFEHVQTEGMNEAFLTLATGAQGNFYDITLRQIAMADNPPGAYMMKVGARDVRDVLVEGTTFASPGGGQPFFDPSSWGNIFGFICLGGDSCPTSVPPNMQMGGFSIPASFGKGDGSSPTFFTNSSDHALTTVNGQTWKYY